MVAHALSEQLSNLIIELMQCTHDSCKQLLKTFTMEWLQLDK